MSHAEFADAFPEESALVERKRGAGGRPIQDAVTAFSNADGGVVLIGVDDDGTIVGRECTPGLSDDLHRTIGELRGAGRYEIHPLLVDGTPVTVLSVARRVEGFAQTSDGRVLIRRGTRKDALFGAELQRFLNERSLRRFEESATDVAYDEADEGRLARLAARYDWRDSDQWASRLAEHGLIADDGRHLTVTGALCLLAEPRTEVGKAFVEVMRFPAGAREYDRRVEFTGSTTEQVDRATDMVADELGSEVVVLGTRRHELPRIPKRVLREAIANAVAHRSYEQSGRSVRVDLRPEAVTITSPGGLPEPVTEQNIRETQAARNYNLLRVLRRFDLAEDRGLGVDVMEDLMRHELLDPPRFRDLDHSVEVTLPIRSAVTPSERAWVREVESRGEIEAGDRILLVQAARGTALTNAVARELLAVDTLTARAALQRLRDAGFLEQRGRRSATVYVIDSSLAPPAGLRLSDQELERLVLEIAAEGEPVTNARVRVRTGLDRVEALRVLDSLVGQGALYRVGERRGTRYLLPERRRVGASP